MRKFFTTIVVRCSIVSLCILIGYGIYALISMRSPYVPNANQDQKFAINPGERSEDVAKKLQDRHLVKDAFLFSLYGRLSGLSSRIQAGEYVLDPGMNALEIFDAITTTVSAKEHEITVIEGWTLQEIALYLEKEGISPREVFLESLKNIATERYSFLAGKKTPSLEGYLFPDTYRIFEDSTPEEVIGKMLDNFDRKYTVSMRKDTRSENRSIHDIVTIASILEGEVQTDEDRAMVAGIFYRRLAKGMPLQSDATVNYVTGKSRTQPSFDDLEVDSRYNTYKYKGLPPGPIGNPGLSSLMAAIYPKKNEYLFFLTTREGKVIYSKDYEEHLTNKRKYLSNN